MSMWREDASSTGSKETNKDDFARRDVVELIGNVEIGQLERSRDQEFRMDFVITSRSGNPASVANSVARTSINMQRLLLEDEERFGDCLGTWFETGNPIAVFKGKNRNHLMAIKEQAETINLPVVAFADSRKKQRAGSFIVVCLFGPVTMLERIVRNLPKV